METTTHHHLRRFADRFFESIGTRIETSGGDAREVTKEPLELEGRTLFSRHAVVNDLRAVSLQTGAIAASGPDV